jgi:Protein of unknown function (DUF3828)
MNKIGLLLTTVLLVAALCAPAAAARRSRKQIGPTQVVIDLYRQHKKRSPFFQKTNRALLDKYFEKNLADLIWKDAQGPSDEVGALDGDPLFNAQDMDIKNFVVHPADYMASYGPALPGGKMPPRNRATVEVTFDNLGQPHTVYFEMSLSRVGWRIWEIRYDDHTQLSQILAGSH